MSSKSKCETNKDLDAIKVIIVLLYSTLWGVAIKSNMNAI